MTSNQSSYGRAHLKASDADRDTVVAELSEHFQAGRLTSEEFEERTGRALEARTIGDLGDLMTDLPAAHRPAAQPAPVAPSGRLASAGHPSLRVALLAFAVVTVVLGAVGGHAGWDFWWVIPALLIARLAICRRRAASVSRRS